MFFLYVDLYKWSLQPVLRAATCLEMKQFPVFFLSGIHAGTDISRLVPWEFPHHVKSSPPKNSEKPGQSAEKRLTQTLQTPQSLQAASNFASYAHNLSTLTTAPSGPEKKTKPLFLSGFFSWQAAACSRCVRSTGFCFQVTCCCSVSLKSGIYLI